jgi:very-short-patch-repair endonuclease
MMQPQQGPFPPLAGGGWGEGAEQLAKASLVAHAKTMRRTAMPAERKLWQALRKHQLGGLKFRRQMPLGPFIADFYCSNARLVVEVDGVSHIDSPTDAIRDVWMKEHGIRVFRVSNLDDVLRNLEGILIAISRLCSQPLPPTPSRKGRGSNDRFDRVAPAHCIEPA